MSLDPIYSERQAGNQRQPNRSTAKLDGVQNKCLQAVTETYRATLVAVVKSEAYILYLAFIKCQNDMLLQMPQAVGHEEVSDDTLQQDFAARGKLN
jgi:hypothetical protein